MLDTDGMCSEALGAACVDCKSRRDEEDEGRSEGKSSSNRSYCKENGSELVSTPVLAETSSSATTDAVAQRSTEGDGISTGAGNKEADKVRPKSARERKQNAKALKKQRRAQERAAQVATAGIGKNNTDEGRDVGNIAVLSDTLGALVI